MTFFQKHKFATHLTAFSLMILAPVFLTLTTHQESNSLRWVLLACFALGSVLAIFVK